MRNKNVLLITLLFLSILCACTKDVPTVDNPSGNNNNTNGGGGGNNDQTPTITAPQTFFIAFQNYAVYKFGDYHYESFTVSVTTTFVMRFACKYKSQAAIVTSDQLANFTSMAAFRGYSIFDNQFGTQRVTLPPGTYYVGVRNTSGSDNEYSVELDLAISLPASDKCSYYDDYLKGSKAFGSGGWLIQPFTIQDGFRYFLDGCNVGMETYIIPSDQVDNFKNNQQFQYYTDYYQSGGDGPGGYEISLPAGNYALAARSTGVSSITYMLERWKKNY